jgi:excisionase family DNA binding protein
LARTADPNRYARRSAGLRGDRIRAAASPVFLTVREVAERLRVCRATVYRMIEEGRLPVVRVSSGMVRVPAENLLAVLAASRLE